MTNKTIKIKKYCTLSEFNSESVQFFPQKNFTRVVVLWKYSVFLLWLTPLWDISFDRQK